VILLIVIINLSHYLNINIKKMYNSQLNFSHIKMAKKPIRIIPRLRINGAILVEGIKIKSLRVLGNPELFAETYYK
jgi:hypothetical protein